MSTATLVPSLSTGILNYAGCSFTLVGTADAGDALRTVGDGKYLYDNAGGVELALSILFADDGVTIPLGATINSVTARIRISAVNGGPTVGDSGHLYGVLMNNNVAVTTGYVLFDVFDVATFNIGALTTYDSHVMTLNPITGGSWTRSAIFSPSPLDNDTSTCAWELAFDATGGGNNVIIDYFALIVDYSSTMGQGYPEDGLQYVQDTDDPPLRRFDASTDSIVTRIPKNPDVSPAAPVKAIVTTLTANGTIYLSTFDGGVTGAAGGTVKGSVFSLNPSTGALTKLGTTFPTGHLPYSLCWGYGRLWCGTGVNNLNDATAGRVYWIRPGIDAAWTLDKTFAASEAIVSGLAMYKGLLYASLLFDSTASGTAKVVVRSVASVWSNSDTGAIGVDGTGIARGYFSLLVWPPEQGALQSPAPCLFAVRKGITAESGYVIRRYTGSAWSTVYSGGAGGPDLVGAYAVAGTTMTPAVWTANGGSSELNSTDGTSWTDRIANVTITAGGLVGLTVQK